MDSNYLLNLLYSTHVQQTLLPNPPFSLTTEFNPELFDKDKYIELSHSEQKFNNFVLDCFEQFKIEYNCAFGSVHLHPETWTKFALKAIVTTWKNNSNQIIFPNGCCSNESCPINNYYLIVLDNLMLKN